MSVDLRHARVSLIPDNGDPAVVQGPDWNAAHTLMQGPSALLGRSDSAPGQAAVQEVQLDPTLAFVSGKLAVSGTLTGPLTAGTLALGGAIIGTNALAVTGTGFFSGQITTANQTPIANASVFGNVALGAAATLYWNNNTLISAPANGALTFNNFNGSIGTTVSFPASNSFQHGTFDAAAPVAQTVSFQSVVAGTTNTAGVNATFAASRGTGTGAGGSLIFQTAPAGTTGTAVNPLVTALTIASGQITLGANVALFMSGDIFTAGTYRAVNTSNRLYHDGFAGIFRFSSAGLTTGASIDVSTDGTMKFRNHGTGGGAPTADAAITAAAINASSQIKVTVADNNTGILVTGVSKAFRVNPGPSFTEIAGTDNTGSGSFQPLNINGSAITLIPPTTMNGALTYGGVTLSNAVTGTGNMALSANPTFTGTVTAADINASSLITVTRPDGNLGILVRGATKGFRVIPSATGTEISGVDNTGFGSFQPLSINATTINLVAPTTISSALTYGGVTLANAVTGTGNMVLSGQPTIGNLTSPTDTSQYACIAGRYSVAFGRAAINTGGAYGLEIQANSAAVLDIDPTLLTVRQAMNYGGVTLSNAVTGTGNMVLSVSPALTGAPTAPTPATPANDTSIATTAWVKLQAYTSGATYAPINSPVFTGDPQAPTPAANDSDTSIATTAFVQAAFGNINTGSFVQAKLGANVPITVLNTFVNGPNTGAIGANGQKWLIFARFICSQSSSSQDYYTGRIWNGSASIDSAVVTSNGVGDNRACPLFAIVTLTGATTFTLQATNGSTVNGNLNSDSIIGAIRLS